MKGIVFAGCSFTWGEGLELYSDLPTLNLESIKRYGYHFPDSGYYMPKSHLKFIESNRFSRLVSHHFGTFDIVSEKNGGNHGTMLNHIKKSLLDYKDDIGLIVVQLTEYLRGIKFGGYDKDLIRMVESYYSVKSGQSDKHLKYYHDIIENHIEGEPMDYVKELGKNKLNKFIGDLEDINKHTEIPIKFLGSWVQPDLPIENDFYDKNLITINYNNKEYKTISDLLSEHNYLIISNELEWSNNWHPNLKFQKIISDSIIDYIEKNNVF